MLAAFPHACSAIGAGTYRESTRALTRAGGYLVCSENFAEQYTSAHVEDTEDAVAFAAILFQIERINGGIAVIAPVIVGCCFEVAQASSPSTGNWHRCYRHD